MGRHKSMPIVISMLRGVNVGRHNRVKMDDLRALYASLKLHDVRTYVQSGNVLFRTPQGGEFGDLSTRIEDAIERKFKFRPTVILRTASELREVIARNPFAKRHALDPAKLLILFLAHDPAREAREQLLQIKTAPEELHISGREVFIYYPDGLARPLLSWTQIEKVLQTRATGRNWNSVLKMLVLAESLESASASG